MGCERGFIVLCCGWRGCVVSEGFFGMYDRVRERNFCSDFF